MFVRKKKNSSGAVGIQVIDKTHGKYHIIGGRVKNETEDIKQWIFSLEKLDGVFYEHPKDDRRLIVRYSEKRAKKIVTTGSKG